MEVLNVLHTIPLSDIAQAAQTAGVLLTLVGITFGCITATKGGQQ